MKNWREKDIEQLKKYLKTLNEYSSEPEIMRNSEKESEILELEAKLLIENKMVVGYINNKAEGVYSFNEALKKQDYYIKQGKLFMYLPIKKH